MARTQDRKSIGYIVILAAAMIAFVCFMRVQMAWGEEEATGGSGSFTQVATSQDQSVATPSASSIANAATGEGAASTSPVDSNANGTIFESGTGTEEDPYVIAATDQLIAFRDSVNAGTTYEDAFITLGQDLDISGSEWVPIGASTRHSSGITSDSAPFKGTFDGDGHTISGLTMTQTQGADYAIGLFGAVMGGAVKNLTLNNAQVNVAESELAGIAVGLLSEGGTVSGITTSGTISAKCGCGGVVGRMTARGTIAQCTNSADVTVTGGSGNCGGIVGAAYYTPEDTSMTISNCTNHGTVTGINDTGGIAGLCCAFVSGCINDGAITGAGYAVGGIAGELKNYGGISHCTNSAAVSNPSTAQPYGTGGIVGWLRYDGAAPAYAVSKPISVTDNLSTGSVTTNSGIGVGGIAGVLYSAGTVSGNENRAQALSGKQFIGGIVGNLQDQGASSLPASVPEGATVVNNVTTTPLAAMTGSLTDTIAYNNDPSLFSVEGNGDAWVAQRSSTGSTAYASLAYAMSNAAHGDTINLIADSQHTTALEAPEGHDVTIALGGHDIQLAPRSSIIADGNTVTITGDGDVYALSDDGKTADATSAIFVEKTSSNGIPGAFQLKGGTYPTDVSEYVAPGYEVETLAQPDAAGNQYKVVESESGNPPEPDPPETPSTPGAPTDDDPSPASNAIPNQTQTASDPAVTPQLGDDMGDAIAVLLLVVGGAALTAGILLLTKGRSMKIR